MNKAINLFEKLAYEAQMEKIAKGALSTFEKLVTKGKKSEEDAYRITAQMLGHTKGDQKSIDLVKNQISAAREANAAKAKQFKMSLREAKPGMNAQQLNQIKAHNKNVSKNKTFTEKGLEALVGRSSNRGSAFLQGEQAKKNIEKAKSLNRKIDNKADIDFKTQYETPVSTKYTKLPSNKAETIFIKSQNVKTPGGSATRDYKIVKGRPISSGPEGQIAHRYTTTGGTMAGPKQSLPSTPAGNIAEDLTLKDRVNQYKTKATQWAKDDPTITKVRQWVKENPNKTIAIGAGTGFGGGALMFGGENN